MIGGMISLFICASLSLNLILHFALGIQGIIEGQERAGPIPFFQGGVLFVSVLVLWFFFSYIIAPLAFGFLEYVLLFPCSALTCVGLETLCARFIPHIVPDSKLFASESGYNGLVLTSLWLTLHIAGTPLDAAILSLSFALGSLFTMVLLHYIRKRSALEMVPVPLRGRPLMLITIGLLSLLFMSLTTIFFTILGIF
ncbi:MAG: hypothetical protein LBD29_06105 [Treponema sp.]|jgi:electron transport complex protein RnfA|nr:hypothetical protein [Treponema sp.]